MFAEAAKESVQVFEAPENAAKVQAVQAECAGDLGKFFMMMIPLATELVGSVIIKYGFDANQQGAMSFVSELQKHQEDAEIKALVRLVCVGIDCECFGCVTAFRVSVECNRVFWAFVASMWCQDVVLGLSTAPALIVCM